MGLLALESLMHRSGEVYTASLAAPDDFGGWREQARMLILAGMPPDRVIWQVRGEGADDLFANRSDPMPPHAQALSPRVPRAFLALAGKAVLHSDPQRFALLYRLLWRLQAQPGLLEDAADKDVRRLKDFARIVRRDVHKMRAFVRFRKIAVEGAGDHYVAWFEPDHHILRANAAFFVNRFTAMNWSILTPAGSLHWDGQVLREGPPARREDAPAGDLAEDLWRKYYSSIFNPARLKVGAMLKEMPRRYWKNLPEAALIPELIAGAQAREAAMVEAGAGSFAAEWPASLTAIADGVATCRRCSIGCNGTRAVAGTGASTARLMIVGEQPGDCEEIEGRPFIGPAGQVLRRHLDAAGIDLRQVWLTNAVKHFKYTAAGRQRLHQNPSAREIDTCRWWLESERELLRPRLILALGASAARAFLGKTVNVQAMRGQAIALDDQTELWITVHPSYLLRLDEAGRAAAERAFAADLGAVALRASEF